MTYDEISASIRELNKRLDVIEAERKAQMQLLVIRVRIWHAMKNYLWN